MSEEYKKSLNKMAALCSRSEKCESDISEKLNKFELTDDEKKSVIKYLKENKYIDNIRFAEFYVKDKFRFNKWGKIKIRAYLNQKQISSSVIDESLNKIDNDNYINVLKEILHKKKETLKEQDEFKLKNKLLRFAASRGFETQLIYSVFDDITCPKLQ